MKEQNSALFAYLPFIMATGRFMASAKNIYINVGTVQLNIISIHSFQAFSEEDQSQNSVIDKTEFPIYNGDIPRPRGWGSKTSDGGYDMEDAESGDKLVNLLKTTRGQIDAVITMVEDKKQCTDILTQMLSAQGLMKKSIVMLLESRIKNCLSEAVKNAEERENKINEIVTILSRLSKG